MKKYASSYEKAFKASIATAMAAGMLVAVAPVHTSASEAKVTSFSDVKNIESHHFYESVMDLASRGIVKGFEDGTFKPSQSVTRGQMAKVLALTLELDIENVKNPGFKDLPTTHQYYGPIAALVEAGIVDGYDDKTFKPGNPITRAHMAKMLQLGFNLEEEKFGNSPFTDVKATHWYADHVQALVANQITTGTTPTTFSPNAYVTRGQMASFIVRSEVAVADAGEAQQSAEVRSVTNNSLELSTGTYALSADLKKIVNESNADALKNAVLTFTVEDEVITNISSIELTENGNATDNLELDGQDATFAGTIKVNGDYIALKNITIQNNLEIGKEVANSFKTTDISVLGKTTISDKVASNKAGKLVRAASTKQPNFAFSNSSFQTMEIARTGEIALELTGNSSVRQLNLSSNAHVKAGSGTSLPNVTVNQGATNITLDGSVDNLSVNTPNPLTISGTANIGDANIGAGNEVNLQTTGKIDRIIVKSKDTKIKLGKDAKVGKYDLPKGTSEKDVVNNSGGSSSSGGSSGGGRGGGNGGNDGNDKGDEPFKLSLMHFNDSHANLDKAPKLVTAVNEVRAIKPDALLLNAGDVFSGTLYFNEFKGQADVEFMNLMKVDAMTFGNHEFDLGSSKEGHKALRDFIKAANFPFVSANADFSKDQLFDGMFSTKISENPERSNIYSGIVKEVDGEKIGIFGLTTAETADIASPGDITFSDYIEEAQTMVDEFEKMGVNKVVAITHIGFDDNPNVDNDQELAKNVAGIDVIVGGHSHTQLDKPVVVEKDKNGNAKDKTIIVQAYQYSDFLGTLDVEFDENGVVVGHAGELIKTAVKAEDAEAVKLLKPYKDQIVAVNEEKIGVTLDNPLLSPRTTDEGYVPGTSVRASETILGNLITDGMLAKAQGYVKDKKVIMAFQNGGGIRAAIGAGPITVGEVITVLPFGNTLATMEVTGAELKEAFEVSVSQYPKESGGFLHVSGAKVEFDSSKKGRIVDDKGVVTQEGERIVSISYKNGDGSYTEIDLEDDETNYTIATNAFTAKGGDGYTVLGKAYTEGRVTDLGLSDWENLREHLLSVKDSIPTEIEGRIVDVADKKSEPELPGGEISAEDFSGTDGAHKVYKDDVTVPLTATDVASLKNVTVKGNLILTGTPKGNLSFANITVEGNLDLSSLNTDNYEFDGIKVTGETIF